MWIALALILILAAVYLGAGYVVYNQLSRVTVYPDRLENIPSEFKIVYEEVPAFDTIPYLMPKYQAVTFPSRQPDIQLAGWYIEASPSAPAVIVTHGIGAGKFAGNALIIAGMLYKRGFNVLLFDLRNHGGSSRDNGRTSIGNKEYLDVLGAWDYLVTACALDQKRIGLYGLSLGAASALNAFAEEPRVAAVLVDSPFADLQQIISEELRRTGYPTFLAPAGIFAARVFGGVDLMALTPKDAIRKSAGRPMFIIHGLQDARVNVRHSQQLMELASQEGANAGVWYVDDAGHVMSEFLHPEAYATKMADFFHAALGN